MSTLVDLDQGYLTNYTDLEDRMHAHRPEEVIRAAEMSAHTENMGEAYKDSNFWSNLPEREVLLEGPDGTFYKQVLVPFIVPTGVTITLGSIVGGVYTPAANTQGALLLKTGAIVGAVAPVDADTIIGALLPHYYELYTAGDYDNDDARALTLEEGDLIWVVRRGRVQLAVGAAGCTDGSAITNGGATAGTVADSAAINTGSVVLYDTTLQQWLHEFKRVGTARETMAAAGFAWCDLELAPHWGTPDFA